MYVSHNVQQAYRLIVKAQADGSREASMIGEEKFLN
jgi:hypothetical protein